MNFTVEVEKIFVLQQQLSMNAQKVRKPAVLNGLCLPEGIPLSSGALRSSVDRTKNGATCHQVLQQWTVSFFGIAPSAPEGALVQRLSE